MWAFEDYIDIFRVFLPVYIFLVFPMFFIIYPLPVSSSVEFPVFRLHQFELHGSKYGSQSSLVNMEARTLESGFIARKCVLIRVLSLTSSIYQQIIDEGAASLVILLPLSLGNLSIEHKEVIWQIEEAMLRSDVQMSVYFAYETEDLIAIYESVHNSASVFKASSAASALITSLSSDGYQIVVSGSQSKKLVDSSISNIYGRLSGYGVEEHLSTIAIVAHYDVFAAAPDLSYGGDSDGSGVVTLLEIARIFSKLYSSPRTHPRMNILFFLSGGGYINYQGSKRFLEDQLDSSDSLLLSELNFALCLDTIANGPSLYLHVSKKPKEDTVGHHFFTILESVAKSASIPVLMVHKKINLQDNIQSWEHEKFSLRRLPAFTLSRIESSETGERGSMTDTFDSLDIKSLTKRVSVVIETLVSLIYNKSAEDVLEGSLAVNEESVRAWVDLLSAQPRSPVLLSGKNSPLVSALFNVLSRYISEVKLSSFKPDHRDPEWAFYDTTKSVMAAYAVKPAIFDFLLTIVIGSYLGAFYLLVVYFPLIYSINNSLVSLSIKTKAC